MPFIRESVVTTVNEDGSGYIAPLGVIEDEPHLVIAPFRPGPRLDNLRRHPFACVNYTVDARIFAGCVTSGGATGRWRRPSGCAAGGSSCPRPQRGRSRGAGRGRAAPRFRCRELHVATTPRSWA